MNDALDLGSFLLMLYTGAVILYVATRAARVGRPYLVLSVLLFLIIIFHGFHHLFAYLGKTTMQADLELAASISALTLAFTYTYLWGHE